MTLIRLHEWLGPNRNADPEVEPVRVQERDLCMATNLPLADALLRIVRYQDAFNSKKIDGRHTVFTLLGVDVIDDIHPLLLGELQCGMIEELEI